MEQQSEIDHETTTADENEAKADEEPTKMKKTAKQAKGSINYLQKISNNLNKCRNISCFDNKIFPY